MSALECEASGKRTRLIDSRWQFAGMVGAGSCSQAGLGMKDVVHLYGDFLVSFTGVRHQLNGK